ncbi:spore coat protein GerQ [Paenibacillus sp. FSL R5-0407]|uniref:spore coat protein GerQ n=1 Tax=Paenibacillus sp. FSL R5-0407 TaxID=2975320 RepID=UPI0030FA3C00
MFNQPYRPVTYHIGGGTPSGTYPSGTGTMGGQPPQVPSGSPMTPSGTVVPVQFPSSEQSFIENILRLNLGKVGTFYMTYENNSEWNAKIFKGVLEAAGRDHIIISDPNTGVRTILLMVNLDFATFDQPLVYQYPGTIGNPPTNRR